MRWRKPAGEISDRGARYRATAPECAPPGPRICIFCGATRNVEVHHLDGEELNTEPSNLVWACRSCNVVIGCVMQRHGLGRRTRQYNPDSRGARTLGQWVAAVLALHGESQTMKVADAVALVHATPPEKRSHFARAIWRIRRERGTDRRG